MNFIQTADYEVQTEGSPLRYRLIVNAFKAVVVLFVLGLMIQAYFLYFVYAANSPENFYYFRSDLTPASKYLVDRCSASIRSGTGSTKQSTYLVLDKFSVQTTDYITSDSRGNFSQPCNVPYIQVDPEDSWRPAADIKDGRQIYPDGLKPGDQVVFTQSSIFDTKKFVEHHPEAHLFLEQRNKFGQAVLAVYKIDF